MNVDDDTNDGYLAAACGAAGGGFVVGALAACVAFAIADHSMRDDPYALPGLAALPIGALGVWIGATLGCWLALRAGEYARAGTKSAILFVLIPLMVAGSGWLILTAGDDTYSWLLLNCVTIWFLPLLARFLT